MGTMVRSFKIPKELPIFTFDVNDLDQGLYNISIAIDNEITKTDKLVVIY